MTLNVSLKIVSVSGSDWLGKLRWTVWKVLRLIDKTPTTLTTWAQKLTVSC
jgi:hypothetical protein